MRESETTSRSPRPLDAKVKDWICEIVGTAG
jgi:hypothetical protein